MWKLQKSELALATNLSHLGLERNVFDGTILATCFLSELEGRFAMVSTAGLLTDTHSCATGMLLRLAGISHWPIASLTASCLVRFQNVFPRPAVPLRLALPFHAIATCEPVICVS